MQPARSVAAARCSITIHRILRSVSPRFYHETAALLLWIWWAMIKVNAQTGARMIRWRQFAQSPR
jgi:hypothetical protein